MKMGPDKATRLVWGASGFRCDIDTKNGFKILEDD